MAIYGYARVSSRDQHLTRQLDAFDTFGIERKNVYCDKMSGKDFERRNYRRLLKRLKRGDLLVVKSIDRLGRNYEGIIAEWTQIVNRIGADILVLDTPLLDTREKENGLVGKFISDLVLQILSFVAENERENIRARQAEGIKSAKLRGVRFGRPCRVYTASFADIVAKYKSGAITLPEALAASSMKRSNFYYHMDRLLAASVQKA